MGEGSREQLQEALVTVKRDRNVMANHVAAAVYDGNQRQAERLAKQWKPLWDQAIKLWLAIGDETGIKGRIES